MSFVVNDSGYQKLWIAVLFRAFRDALLENDNDPNHRHNFWWPRAIADKKSIPMVRDRAKWWLLENTTDFNSVCDFAGVNPVTARAYFKKVFSDAAAAQEVRSRLEVAEEEGAATLMCSLPGDGELRPVGERASGDDRALLPDVLGTRPGGPSGVRAEHQMAGRLQ